MRSGTGPDERAVVIYIYSPLIVLAPEAVSVVAAHIVFVTVSVEPVNRQNPCHSYDRPNCVGGDAIWSVHRWLSAQKAYAFASGEINIL